MPVDEVGISDDVPNLLLAWSRDHLRDLPWRASRDPWAILVAETMLQQTQVARVVERWPLFLKSFPDASTCAARPVGDVVHAWKGLGYNRRAVALHAAATMIVARHDGELPSDLPALLELPGVGPYTARAVRAFAFELPAAVVDTNVGRLFARLAGRPLRPREAQAAADALAVDVGAWEWNQGVMELGALVCGRRRPDCGSCPLSDRCAWRGVGPDPATGSAGVGRPQSTFEGSNRQLRGRLVDVLRSEPVRRVDIERLLGVDRDRVDEIIDGLLRDGLAVVAGEHVQLP
jgi:A/G-specific adenine glycosylase